MSGLTGTTSEAAAYEFTTLTTVPGTMTVHGAKLQILDLPGIIEGAKDGKGRGRQVIAVARTCNLIFIVLDVCKPLVSTGSWAPLAARCKIALGVDCAAHAAWRQSCSLTDHPSAERQVDSGERAGGLRHPVEQAAAEHRRAQEGQGRHHHHKREPRALYCPAGNLWLMRAAPDCPLDALRPRRCPRRALRVQDEQRRRGLPPGRYCRGPH